MKAISWNTDWFYSRLDESENRKAVTLPHDAMIEEKKSNTAAGGTNTGWYEGFDYVYEKEIPAENPYAGQTAILEFEGVYHNAEVWLDNEKLGFRPYGYTNFYVDITKAFGDGSAHKLKVIARNAKQPNSRWYSGAGIYRPVTLWVGGEKYILVNGIHITTLSIEPATIKVDIGTNCEGVATVELLDGDRAISPCQNIQCAGNSPATAIFTVDKAQLWDTDSPYIYTCRVSFGDDVVCEPFGIRTISWSSDGFKLNDKRKLLLGACVHHDNSLLGACCDADAVERKVRKLKEVGYNALRSAHNPCSKAFLNACDRQGMLVMDEYIDHWYIHKTEYDYVDYFQGWWKKDLADMVAKDYNHPCVIMYSTGNEVSETAQPRGIELTKELTDYLHSLDKTRPVTCGINIFFNFLSSVGFGVYSDKKAKKEAEAAAKAKAAGKTSKKKAVGSQFFNNLAGLLGDEFMKRGATLHGCDVKTRDAFENMDIAGYNYGIYRYGHDLKKYPNRLILGSETFCNDAYRFYEMAKENPRIVGDFVWAGMDYLGEVMVGSWEYSDYAKTFDGGLGWVSAGSGRVDLTGKPLCEALYTRIAFEKETGPRIGVRPVNHTGDRHSPSAWKMSNAIESWSFEGCDGKKAEVEVYARAARVELFVNGRRVGSKTLKKDCIARFRCIYEHGEIKAVAYDDSGKILGENILRSASKETRLTAVAESNTVEAERLAYIRLKYTDEAGEIKPLCRGLLTVRVEGGTLVGLGNGCPYNERGYTTDKTETYYGEALAIVRAGKSGTVRLHVTDDTYETEIEVPVVE